MRDMIKDYVRGDLPSLSALLAVVAAGERGGFTAAAQALGITQSAISREIRQIEERLGRALFRRSPRGVELTDEGRRTLDELWNERAAVLAARIAGLTTEQSQVLDAALEAIIQAARTDKIGDGQIFVSPVEQVLRIRTGEVGKDAL